MAVRAWLSAIVDRALQTLGDAAATLAYVVGLVVLVAVGSHALAWLLTRRRTAAWVWGYWNGVGAAILVVGLAAVAYAWLAVGLATPLGSAVAGVGLLLLSAGLWMLVPV